MDEKLKELKLLAGKSYNLCSVLKEYCKPDCYDTEKDSNVYTMVEYLYDNIDTLNSIFINMDLS